MTNAFRPPAPADTTGRRFAIERTYKAPLVDLWNRWTTKAGIETWWGPEGFAVTVRQLDLRPGGELLYDMTAVGRAQILFMKSAGLPVTTEAKITYTEVVPLQRLAYETLAEFIPGVEPYAVTTVVELHPDPKGVRMVLTFDAMHDDEWTKRSAMGHESELRKLDTVVEARA